MPASFAFCLPRLNKLRPLDFVSSGSLDSRGRSIPRQCAKITISNPMARQSTHQTKANPEKSPRRDPTASGDRDAAVNRIASHNYFLLEKFEAGVVLTGTEVKSVRGGLANLKDSYGLVKDDAVWLLNAHIGPYEHGNIFNHAPLRTRKLLMHREEIRKLIGKTQQKGLTLIPTRMYFKNGRVKVELALAKGKQLWDKRETERRRTADKEAREAVARGRSQKAEANDWEFTVKTVNLKSDMPSVQEALQRLDREIAVARQQKHSLLKFVHGYGSSGVGGDIRIAVQRRLHELVEAGQIRGCIFGENWSKTATRPSGGCCRRSLT